MSDGLYRFDQARNRLAKFIDPLDPALLNKTIVNKIYQDREGILWLASRGEGLYKFDKQPQKITNYQNNPDNSNSLSSNAVRAIL